MRTFIFIKTFWRNARPIKTIVGFTQGTQYPSNMIRDEKSQFYDCDCIEIKEQCHVELGVIKGF